MALQDQQAVCNANAEEIIGSMRTVRACGAEDQEVGAYVGGLHLILALGYRQALAYVGYMFFVMGAPLLVTVAVLYFGAHMVLHHGLEPGDMVTLHPKPHTIHPQPCTPNNGLQPGDMATLGGHTLTLPRASVLAEPPGHACVITSSTSPVSHNQ